MRRLYFLPVPVCRLNRVSPHIGDKEESGRNITGKRLHVKKHFIMTPKKFLSFMKSDGKRHSPALLIKDMKSFQISKKNITTLPSLPRISMVCISSLEIPMSLNCMGVFGGYVAYVIEW